MQIVVGLPSQSTRAQPSSTWYDLIPLGSTDPEQIVLELYSFSSAPRLHCFLSGDFLLKVERNGVLIILGLLIGCPFPPKLWFFAEAKPVPLEVGYDDACNAEHGW